MSRASHSSHGMPALSDADPQTARALQISAWLTGVHFIIELAIGLYTGSVAVISDAFHTFSAVGGIVLAIAADALRAVPRIACVRSSPTALR